MGHTEADTIEAIYDEIKRLSATIARRDAAMYKLVEGLVNALDGTDESDGWICVADKMPDEGETVIGYDMRLGVRFAMNAEGDFEDVTHWMALPEPPRMN